MFNRNKNPISLLQHSEMIGKTLDYKWFVKVVMVEIIKCDKLRNQTN